MDEYELQNIIDGKPDLKKLAETKKNDINNIKFVLIENIRKEVNENEYATSTIGMVSTDVTSISRHRITTKVLNKYQNGSKYVLELEITTEFVGDVYSEYELVDRRLVRTLGLPIFPPAEAPNYNLKSILLYVNGAKNFKNISTTTIVAYLLFGTLIISVVGLVILKYKFFPNLIITPAYLGLTSLFGIPAFVFVILSLVKKPPTKYTEYNNVYSLLSIPTSSISLFSTALLLLSNFSHGAFESS